MPSFFGGSARRGSETGARSSVVSSSSSRRSLWEREVDPSDSVSQASGPRSSHRSHSSRHFQASDYSRALSSRHNMSSSRMSDARTVAPSNYTSSRMSSSSRRDPARLSRPGDAPDLQRADLMWRRSSCETSVSGVPYMGSAGAVAPYSPERRLPELDATATPGIYSLPNGALFTAKGTVQGFKDFPKLILVEPPSPGARRNPCSHGFEPAMTGHLERIRILTILL
ncbi:hypothetical protein BDW69DRAFT_184146 [Aspergillus filifer]